MLGLKLIHVSKRGHWWYVQCYVIRMTMCNHNSPVWLLINAVYHPDDIPCHPKLSGLLKWYGWDSRYFTFSPLAVALRWIDGGMNLTRHYCDVIMDAMASQITILTIVYSTVYSDADRRRHQSSASLASVRGIHRGPVNSPHKGPVTRKMFPLDDVIMDKQSQNLRHPCRLFYLAIKTCYMM